MLKNVLYINLFLLLAITSSVSLAIDKIEIYSQSNKAFFNGYQFLAPLKQNIDSYLEFGDKFDGQLIKITSSKAGKYSVSVQFETSLTIMDEGPHLDLTEWKHCTTDWIDLKLIKSNEFKLPEAKIIDENCFPNVSDNEVRAEVYRVAGERWSSLLKGDIDVNEYPLGISLSTVKVRIKEEVNGLWKVITKINFIVPMGC